MALTNCTECNQQISDAATTCPHCGAPGPARIAARRAEQAYAECRQEAIRAGALQPKGIAECMMANLMDSQGKSWANTAAAQQRLEAWTQEIMRKKGYSV